MALDLGDVLDELNPFSGKGILNPDRNKSDYKAYAPALLTGYTAGLTNNYQDAKISDLFRNPAAVAGPGGQQSLRDSLQAQFYNQNAADRAVPLAQRSVATPVASAARSSLDLGLLAPGAAVTAGALGQGNESRGLQGMHLGLLGAAATGAAPSAAEQQMQAGLGQSLRGNLALAASARGTAGDRVAAQRAAASANADASAQVLGQTGALRAQEQAAARQLLTGALGEVRGQDLQGANVGLGLGQIGANLAGAQLGSDTSTALGNLQSGTSLSLGQLTADQGTALANMDATLRSRGMDDAQRFATLGALLGIDASTQEGMIALQKLISDNSLKAQQINAGTAMGNVQASAQGQSGILGGFSNILAAGFG